MMITQPLIALILCSLVSPGVRKWLPALHCFIFDCFLDVLSAAFLSRCFRLYLAGRGSG